MKTFTPEDFQALVDSANLTKLDVDQGVMRGLLRRGFMYEDGKDEQGRAKYKFTPEGEKMLKSFVLEFTVPEGKHRR